VLEFPLVIKFRLISLEIFMKFFENNRFFDFFPFEFEKTVIF